jgi:hypothetical protein
MDEDKNEYGRFTPEEQEQLKKAFDKLDKLQEGMWKGHFPHGGIPYPHSHFYKLDKDKNPVPCSSFEYSMQFEDPEKRRVAKTQLGPYTVSTVFLCIDHNFGGEGPPVLFETMIWSDKKTDKPGEFFEFQTRYCTWKEATEGHEFVVQMIKEGQLP